MLAYDLCFWIKGNAYIYAGSPDLAFDALREDLALGLPNSDLSRTLRFITALQCQFFLGDSLTVWEIKILLEPAMRYLQQQTTHREQILDFIYQGAPNAVLFLHHIGCSVPEIATYLKGCLWVKQEAAYFHEKRVAGYPIALGHGYAELFSQNSQTSSRTLLERTKAHRKALGILTVPYPPQVSDALVSNTLAHLIAQNVITAPTGSKY
jgi:hypothetical protein